MPAVPRDPRDERATAKKALAEIGNLSKRFEEHAELDRDELARINRKLDDHGETLADLRESCAETRAEVRALTSEIRYQRELQKAEAIADINDRKDELAAKRKLRFEWAKILPALLLGGAGALITAIATGKIP